MKFSCTGTVIFRSCVAATALSLVGCASTSPQPSAAAAQQEKELKVGMSKQEVESMLGKPASVSTSSDGNATWSYTDNAKMWIPFYAISGGKFKNVTINFDSEGKVKTFTTSDSSIY